MALLDYAVLLDFGCRCPKLMLLCRSLDLMLTNAMGPDSEGSLPERSFLLVGLGEPFALDWNYRLEGQRFGSGHVWMLKILLMRWVACSYHGMLLWGDYLCFSLFAEVLGSRSSLGLFCWFWRNHLSVLLVWMSLSQCVLPVGWDGGARALAYDGLVEVLMSWPWSCLVAIASSVAVDLIPSFASMFNDWLM